ncbi:hypothetical protein PRK78_002271 [Emydomyces testavorans]|uniref:Uncharacterized protein n=1 Tax=Emydomyces testavorans TaxID=2070801 RepID=A0AAF0IHM6_9EURO|nr:hypothetical protein PRK78_002271 [Emydomyces testavorans]
MGDTSIEDVVSKIQLRIHNLRLLLLERLTPLLRNQILHAIRLHSEALEQTNIKSYLADLDTVHEQVMEHWTKVYGNLTSRADLLQDMVLFQQFLTAKLLEDYTQTPCKCNDFGVVLVMILDAVKDGHQKATGYYQTRMVYPLEEMMLDRDHVEKKLRTAAAGQAGGDVQPLIDRCDWSTLAATLMSDRELALKLNERALDGFTFEIMRATVLRKIDKIKSKYFAELSHPSTFTISARAREMSARQASNNTNQMSSPAPPTTAPSNTSPSSETHPFGKGFGFAWSIYNTLTGLKHRSTPASSSADWDETTSLIKLEKTE